MIGSIAQNVINVTDTAFLGRLSEVALGGGAIGGLFYLAIIMLGWGVGIGAQIMVARRYGEGTHRQIGRIIQHTQYFLWFLAVVLILSFEIFGKTLLNHIVESENVFNASYDFLRYRIWGLLFAYTFFSCRACYVGIGRTKVITFTTLVMVFVNVFFGYSLIFGHFGFPKMGISGAGLASVIAEFSGAAFFLIYMYSDKSLRQFNLFRFTKFSPTLMKRLMNISVPLMLQNFFSFAIWFIFFLVIEKMGEMELAVSNIVRSIYVVLLIPIMGFSTAANTLVSFVIGQGRSKEVLSLTWRIAAVAAMFSTVLSLSCILFPQQILTIYSNDATIIAKALPVLRVVTISSIILAAALVVFNGVSGTGRTNISLILEVSVLAFYVIISYLFAIVLNLPLAMVWTVEILYGGMLLIISFIYLKSNHWVGKEV